jgi:hypothetical protein
LQLERDDARADANAAMQLLAEARFNLAGLLDIVDRYVDDDGAYIRMRKDTARALLADTQEGG